MIYYRQFMQESFTLTAHACVRSEAIKSIAGRDEDGQICGAIHDESFKKIKVFINRLGVASLERVLLLFVPSIRRKMF